MNEAVAISGPLWRWTAGNGVSWFFVTVDGAAGEDLSAAEAMQRLELGGKRGFRSLKVEVRVGATTWQTSCFPQNEGGWLLPVKAQVRKAEGLAEGEMVNAQLRAI